MADPIERARALLDRHEATTGFFKWTAHNPPPAMEDMADAITGLLDEIARLQKEMEIVRIDEWCEGYNDAKMGDDL